MNNKKNKSIRESIHSESHVKLRGFLKKKRRDLGLTQRALAAKLEVTHSLISKVETGDRRLDIVELKRYLKAIDSCLIEVNGLIE